MPAAMLKVKHQINDASSVTAFYSYDENPEKDVPYNAFNPDALDTLVDRTTKNTTAYLAYNYKPEEGGLIDTTVKLSYSDEKMYISSDDDSYTFYNNDHRTQRWVLSAENTANFDTGRVSHQLITGVELGREKRSALDEDGVNDYSSPGGYKDHVAAYAIDKMSFGRLTVTPQLRYEWQRLISENNDYVYSSGWTSYPAIPNGTQHDKGAWTGGLAARYALTDSWAVFGTLSYNENLPILDDLRDDFYNQSERSVTKEAGLSFDRGGVLRGDDRLRAKVTGYETRIWDGTTYTSDDQLTLKGVELEGSYAIGDWFADMNGTRSRGTVDRSTSGTKPDPDYFNYIPADNVRLSVGRHFLGDQLTLSAEAVHAWAQNRTTTTTYSAYTIGTYASDAYTVYNLAASYKPSHGALESWEFQAGISNVGDLTYRPYLSTRNAAGRTFKLTVAKTF